MKRKLTNFLITFSFVACAYEPVISQSGDSGKDSGLPGFHAEFVVKDFNGENFVCMKKQNALDLYKKLKRCEK